VPDLCHCSCQRDLPLCYWWEHEGSLIAKVNGNQQRGLTTNEAAMRLRGEKTLPPATLASLTDQKVESKTKPIRWDVAVT
jgi:hypothetical protein